jgi:predicted CXXCH cytochrome family protein
MTVTTSTCFLCHFKDGVLNQALGACTRCHQIPEDTFDLGGGVKFTHELAYERGVDCANCHSDLIRGNGEVPVQRCTVCHNRPADLKRIDDYEFIHQMHVSEHKVDCFDCHTEIQHALDPHKIEHAASDCRSCHPNQHGEQIRLLRGEGGKSIAAEPRGMGIARIACPSCHQVKETSVTGTVLWRASTAVCTQCHDEAATERLLTRHGQLKDTMADIEAGLSRAREALTAATLDEKQKTEFTQRLRDLGDDLQFVRVGNSIHNMHYADSLVQALVNNLRAISRDLDIAEPTIHLPEKLD